MRHYRLYLKDIVDAIEAIEKFIQDMEFDEFRQDDKTSSAVIRKLEIIGEAAKGVPEYIRQEYPHVPWRGMTGMRDELIHRYFGVDYKLTWQTIKHDLPPLKPMICQILDELPDDVDF